jgi:hypothetical protein
MTTIDKLDKGLEIVYRRRKISTNEWLSEMGLDIVELGGILDLLVDDKYVQEVEIKDLKETLLTSIPHTPKNYYTNLVITAKGDLFWSRKGYAGDQQRQDGESIRLANLERSARVNRNWMLLLTSLVAAGTLVAAAYYGIEVWKFFCSCP